MQSVVVCLALLLGIILAGILLAFALSVRSVLVRSDVETVASGVARLASHFATQTDMKDLLLAIERTDLPSMSFMVVDTKANEIYNLVASNVEQRALSPAETEHVHDITRAEQTHGGGSHAVITRRMGMCSNSMQHTITASVRSKELPNVIVAVTGC